MAFGKNCKKHLLMSPISSMMDCASYKTFIKAVMSMKTLHRQKLYVLTVIYKGNDSYNFINKTPTKK